MKKHVFTKRMHQIIDTVLEDFDEEDLTFAEFWSHVAEHIDDNLDAEELDDAGDEDEDDPEDF